MAGSASSGAGLSCLARVIFSDSATGTDYSDDLPGEQKKGVFTDVVGPQHLMLGHGYLGLVRALGDVLNRTVRPAFLGGTPRKYKFIMMQPSNAELQEMADLAREGKLRPIVDEVFKFEDAQRAYERQKSGR